MPIKIEVNCIFENDDSAMPISFNGSVIPAAAVAKAKAGIKVAAVIKYNGTGGASNLEAVFTVKP